MNHWDEITEARLKMRQAFMEMSALADRCDAPELSVRVINEQFWDGNEDMNALLAEMKGAIGDHGRHPGHRQAGDPASHRGRRARSGSMTGCPLCDGWCGELDLSTGEHTLCPDHVKFETYLDEFLAANRVLRPLVRRERGELGDDHS